VLQWKTFHFCSTLQRADRSSCRHYHWRQHWTVVDPSNRHWSSRPGRLQGKSAHEHLMALIQTLYATIKLKVKNANDRVKVYFTLFFELMNIFVLPTLLTQQSALWKLLSVHKLWGEFTLSFSLFLLKLLCSR